MKKIKKKNNTNCFVINLVSSGDCARRGLCPEKKKNYIYYAIMIIILSLHYHAHTNIIRYVKYDCPSPRAHNGTCAYIYSTRVQGVR